jgi:hypothetical protein
MDQGSEIPGLRQDERLRVAVTIGDNKLANRHNRATFAF